MKPWKKETRAEKRRKKREAWKSGLKSTTAFKGLNDVGVSEGTISENSCSNNQGINGAGSFTTANPVNCSSDHTSSNSKKKKRNPHFRKGQLVTSFDKRMQRSMHSWDRDRYGQWGGPAYPDRNPYKWQRQAPDQHRGQKNWSSEEFWRDDIQAEPAVNDLGDVAYSSWSPDATLKHAAGPAVEWRQGQINPDNVSRDQNEINLNRDRQRPTSDNVWKDLSMQFGNRHFHREDVNCPNENLNNSHNGLNITPIDSSVVEDLSSSGGGRKRPRSLDRGQVSKSFRSTNSKMRTAVDYHLDSKNCSDLKKSQNPDLLNGQRNSGEGQTALFDSSDATNKSLELNSKKSTFLKSKSPITTFGPKAVNRAANTGEKADGAGGEGVLEKAEKMCKELREMRENSAKTKTLSKVHSLCSALNGSKRQFDSAHKSFLQNCVSNSNSVIPNTSAGINNDAIPETQKKHFSSASSDPKQTMCSSSANACDSGTDAGSSSHASDIDRIRYSIESSVIVKGTGNPVTTRGQNLSGSKSSIVSLLSSVANTIGTDRVSAPTPSVVKSLSLSKDALAKMVNAPRNRFQRLQLARVIRQSPALTTVRSRDINLDGIYDREDDDDGNSIEDVLKNISGLEEIGECAELKKIKLEDLTSEDKQHIAEMIEGVDKTDRDFQLNVIEPRDEVVLPPTKPHQSRNPVKMSTSDNPRSGQQLNVTRQSPSKPLTLDDLSTAEKSGHAIEKCTVSVSRSSLHGSTSSGSTIVTAALPLSEATAKIASPVSGSSFIYSACPKSVSVVSQSTRASMPVQSSLRCTPEPFVSPNRYEPATENLSSVAGSIDHVEMMDVEMVAKPSDTDRTSSDGIQPASEHHQHVSNETPPATLFSAGNDPLSERTDALYKIHSLCQRQDVIMTEMRDIDDELLQMYKSIIEIVARMSVKQKRRKELQSEGEELSRQRNQLLAGLIPDGAARLAETGQCSSSASVTVGHSPDGHPASEDNREKSQSDEGHPSCPTAGTSVILPRWLSQSPSKRSGIAEYRLNQRIAGETAVSTNQLSDVCLSGSITSSVSSHARFALSQSNTGDSNVDSVLEAVLDQGMPPSGLKDSNSVSTEAAGRAGRVMLSINGIGESTGNKEVGSNQPVTKNILGTDNSSGIGSSISAHSGHNVSTTASGIPAESDSWSAGAKLGMQTGVSQLVGSSKLDVSSLVPSLPTSATGSQNQNVSHNRSPGISVAYLGPLSQNLVQQIVRNLPQTSQLGEINRPAMFVLKSSSTTADGTGSSLEKQETGGVHSTRERSLSADSFTKKSRTRTLSMCGISSNIGEEKPLSVSVPPLKLGEGSYDDKVESKICTPRSESDAHSVASGASLGEQIKLFSERNSSGQGTASNLSSLSFIDNSREERSTQDVADCSLILDKPDKNLSNPHGSWKIDEDETERPKRRKSKKDRDQSLQRRRRFTLQSTSEEEEVKMANEFSDVDHPHQQNSSTGDDELMKVGCEKEEDLDSTLERKKEWHGQSDDEDVVHSHAATPLQSCISPSRLKLKPDNLEAFRANVRRTFATSAALDASSDSSLKSLKNSVVRKKKEQLKLSGPITPIMGMCVHGNLLYVGFRDIGVNSYSMSGQLVMEYPVAAAQCFTVIPAGSGSQYYLAVGCLDQVTFLSVSDMSVVNILKTATKVMCLTTVDTVLYAGLDSGAVIVVSLTTLKKTHEFQACDCAIHSMTWTREGSTRLLIVSAQDARIHVLDVGSGLPVRIISGHSKTAFTLLMVDHFLLSGSGDRKVMAHNVHTAELSWELNDHKSIVTSVCVDNGLLFTAGYDKVIRCYDLKTRRLLHLMYGAGKCVIMKMIVHNSTLYTGNRDGEVEAVDLRDMGSFACGCVSCSAVFGLKEHLWHHLVADHLVPNTQAMPCPWSDCDQTLNTKSGTLKGGEHMRRHIDGNHQSNS